MVTYEVSDLIDVEAFAYAWRLADVNWNEVSVNPLMHFCPLSRQRSQIVQAQSREFRRRGPYSLDMEHYHPIQGISLVENDAADTLCIRKWFAGLPLKLNKDVYVSWANLDSVAVVTTWEAFTQLWDSLWYPFDVVDVFDESLDWAVMLGPEEYAIYAERGKAHQKAGESDNAIELGLVHAMPLHR